MSKQLFRERLTTAFGGKRKVKPEIGDTELLWHHEYEVVNALNSQLL